MNTWNQIFLINGQLVKKAFINEAACPWKLDPEMVSPMLQNSELHFGFGQAWTGRVGLWCAWHSAILQVKYYSSETCLRSTIHSWYNMKYWRNWWHVYNYLISYPKILTLSFWYSKITLHCLLLCVLMKPIQSGLKYKILTFCSPDPVRSICTKDFRVSSLNKVNSFRVNNW